MILWIDVETTGLNPKTDHLLEVALLMTTDQLLPVTKRSVVINPGPVMQLDEYVEKMHTKNGLLEEVRSYGVPTSEATEYLRDWMESVFEDPPPLAGSSVQFDRGFIAEHMPALHDLIHYRNIDVSTIKELARRFDGVMPTSEKSPNHRAEEDIMYSIAELQHYIDKAFINPGEKFSQPDPSWFDEVPK